MHRLLLHIALAASCSATLALAQNSVVLPNGYANAVENSANIFPYGTPIAPTYTGLRILHNYDSTNLTDQLITYPITITGLKFRATNTTASWTGGTYSTSTIQMSTAAVDYLATNTNYPSNHGPNVTTVYTGPVVVQPGIGNGIGVPGPFHIAITLGTPFSYDPNAGDLCIECDVPGTSWGGGGLVGLAQLSATAVPLPLARRVYGSAAYPNANGVDQNILVCELQYHPTGPLQAVFTANVTRGAAPLSVNFTDQSYAAGPGGVTSWAWDFNGDNVVDSTLQNPTFVYPTCGSFPVRLTVTDATHAPSTLTRTAYIKPDLVTASFTQAFLAPPSLFQFTDTSTGPANAWAWDFNGDNITDSTLQNPVSLLPVCAMNSVRLTATRNCYSDTTTKTFFSSPSSITTQFLSNNSGAAGWTVYYDVNVTNAAGINICGLATNTINAANTGFSLEFYVTPGTHAGKDANAAAWRLAGTATGTTSGPQMANMASFSIPVYLPSGSYGIAVRYINIAPAYTNGPLGPYTNADLTMTLGSSRGTTAPFTGGTFFPSRIWNGSLFYDTLGQGATAGYGFFEAGCVGPLGVTNLQHTSRPQLGTTLNVNLNNLPLSVAIQMIGFSRTTSAFGPLPLNLALLGAPGCTGNVSPDATVFIAGSGNSATWSLFVPSNSALIGVRAYNQALVLAPGFNALGGYTSDATALLIGN